MQIKWLDKFDGLYIHTTSIFEWLIEHEKKNPSAAASVSTLIHDLNHMIDQIQGAEIRHIGGNLTPHLSENVAGESASASG